MIFICFASKSIAVEGNKNSSMSAEEQQAAYKAVLEKKAKQGDLVAQRMLGDSYRIGVFEYNIPKAIKWYSVAANRGDIDAQYNLGVIYGADKYNSIDDVKALKWLTKAANQGDRRAKIFLAFLYRDGSKNIPKNKEKADMYAKEACSGRNYAYIEAVMHPDSLDGQCLVYNDFKGLHR